MFVEDQVSVEDWPEVIEVGEAVRERVGDGVGSSVVGVGSVVLVSEDVSFVETVSFDESIFPL